MVWDDYDREWKNTQRRFVAARDQVTQAQLEQAARGVDQKQAGRSCRRSWPRPRRTSPPTRQKVDELQAQLERRRRAARTARQQDYQFAKATYDQDRYDFEAARANGDSERRAQGRGGRGAEDSG